MVKFFYYLGNKVVGGLVKKKCDIIWTLICRRDIKSLNTCLFPRFVCLFCMEFVRKGTKSTLFLL